MAYGLRIDNGSGQRVVDDSFNGVYYLGRSDLQVSTAHATVTYSVDSSYSEDNPPMVFVKLPDEADDLYVSTEKLTRGTGTNPGGLATFSIDLDGDGSNIVWAAQRAGVRGSSPITDAGDCTAVGGSIVGGICVRTADLGVSVDTKPRGSNRGDLFVNTNLRTGVSPAHPNTLNSTVTIGVSTTITMHLVVSATTVNSWFADKGEATLNGNRVTWNSTTGGTTNWTMNGVRWWDGSGNEILVDSGTISSGFVTADFPDTTFQEVNGQLSFDALGAPTVFTVTDSGEGWSDISTDDAYDQLRGAIKGSLGTNSLFSYLDVGGNYTATPTPSVGAGFYPYNTVTSEFDPFAFPEITATTLAQGWIATFRSNITSSTTPSTFRVYVFGIGGKATSADTHGLEIRDTSGSVAFSTRRPPPNIRSIETVSITGLKYSDNGLVGIKKVNSANLISTTFPAATTAVHAPPLGVEGTVGEILNDATFRPCVPLDAVGPACVFADQYFHEVSSFGMAYNVNGGSNIDGITGVGVLSNSTITIQTSASAASPMWEITSGGYGSVDITVGQENYSTLWNVNSQVTFLDTTVFDLAEFDF